MKTSDYIAKKIHQETDHVFGVTGGCIINIVDSFQREGINIVSMHHEQSAAIAADAYGRFKPLGVCYGTSGPGVTNLLTGVCCSYYDSVPLLAIGGQVPTKYLDGKDRQMGFQEVNGVDIFKSVTKLSKRYTHDQDLQDCINIAKTPRKGSTYIEIPDDIQRKNINTIEKETPEQRNLYPMTFDLGRYKKPLAIIGYGAYNTPINIEIPFLYTWRTKDLFYNHPYCKGGFGITGDSQGNKLLKEADCLVFIGTRMDSHQLPKWDNIKTHTISIGLEFPFNVNNKIEYDLNKGLYILGNNWCDRVAEDSPNTKAYNFIDELCTRTSSNDVIIPDMGQIGCIAFQRWKVKEGQRLFNGMNHSPMGYSLPASIGTHYATGKRVIVIIGEGSLMMNIHDLQTISDLNLPINIFVISNGGYGMIRQTQNDWKEFLLQGVGCNFNTPNIKKIAEAFNLNYTNQLSDNPSIYEVKISNTRIIPKWKYGEEL